MTVPVGSHGPGKWDARSSWQEITGAPWAFNSKADMPRDISNRAVVAAVGCVSTSAKQRGAAAIATTLLNPAEVALVEIERLALDMLFAAGRQLADGFELLRLAQLGLGGLDFDEFVFELATRAAVSTRSCLADTPGLIPAVRRYSLLPIR